MAKYLVTHMEKADDGHSEIVDGEIEGKTLKSAVAAHEALLKPGQSYDVYTISGAARKVAIREVTETRLEIG
jgi:hypothetical protein